MSTQTSSAHGKTPRDLSATVVALTSLSGEGSTISGEISVVALSEGVESEDLRVKSPAHLDLTLRRDGGRFLAHGTVEATIHQPCSRCLAEFDTRLMMRFERFYMIGSDPDDVPGEHQMEEDLVYLEEGELSLKRLVAEEVILSVPMVPLCSEACAGLCAGCGADLNREQCGCADPEPTGPFAALANLKISS
ncbi:MAG: DUF177 domain-containing protein [Magnetococcales bacterium]|nr:DUF177 domain-containing protein [Magnetococcales bacterium]